MNTTIKYANTRGGLITEQQLSVVKDYNKQIYQDDVLKRIDVYYDGKLHSGIYYLSQNEDKQGVLSEFSSIWNDIEIYFNIQDLGGFSSKEWEIYIGFDLVSRGRTIFDNLDREIARQILDINSLEPIFVEKIFYLTSLSGFNNDDDLPRFGQFDFYYNVNSNEIKAELNLSGFELDRYIIADNENILNHPMIRPIFKWEDHPYYHSALPLIPNTSNV